MASLDSYTRSAARATCSAYKRLPIRWRLAGGSAALTLVILCGFASIVGVLTTKRIQSDFNRQVAAAADELARTIHLRPVPDGSLLSFRWSSTNPDLDTYAAPQHAAIRVVALDGTPIRAAPAPTRRTSAPRRGQATEIDGWRVESREIQPTLIGKYYVQYARRLSDVRATANRVKLFLALGVLGGAALALLAGLATARRAMAPIAELTRRPRGGSARTRDPSLRLPRPEADDEVAELAAHAGGDARGARSTRAARPRRRSPASASSSPTPRTSCARR